MQNRTLYRLHRIWRPGNFGADEKNTLVHDRKWIAEKEFMEALSLAQILPGATGVSVLGYVG
jgi:chromate transport protein ChrA